MSTPPSNLPAWFHEAQARLYAKLPATVLYCLTPGEFDVRGTGYGNVSIDIRVPTALIPVELRIPNARIWVQCDPVTRKPLRVWARAEGESP